MLHNKVVFDQFKIANLDSVNVYFWFYPNVLAQEHGTSSDIERLKLQFIAGPDNSNQILGSVSKRCLSMT